MKTLPYLLLLFATLTRAQILHLAPTPQAMSGTDAVMNQVTPDPSQNDFQMQVQNLRTELRNLDEPEAEEAELKSSEEHAGQPARPLQKPSLH